ncbi:MAG: SprT-like domain-containing protein [Omnitrophica WOR_2 bacterium]|jgi:hypothetical protein
MNKNRTLRQALPDFIPLAAVDKVATWFDENHVILKITRNRRTKLGDFRSAPPGKPCAISVNHDLNRYSFLITLLHEIAHAEVHLHTTRRVEPHGDLWKSTFRKIAQPFLYDAVFPEPLRSVFASYLINPLASSTSHLALATALKEFDTNVNEITVSMLQPETLFALPNGRVFKMLGKVRKRYRCYCLDNRRTYLFSPIAVITPVTAEKP